jgi:hypothetical protein
MWALYGLWIVVGIGVAINYITNIMGVQME